MIHSAASLTYTLEVVEDGRTVRRLPPKKNLIVDAGLNLIANYQWAHMLGRVQFGTGTMPTKRDSGAITFARVGTTITASAGFFEADDVGRLLKWDTGEEIYITGYVSDTQVSCATGADIAAAQGTIWYVNRTTLLIAGASTTTRNLLGDASAWGTTYSGGNQLTHRACYISAVQAAPITISEVAWGHASAGTWLFGMDLLPIPIALAVGQQLRVKLALTVTFTAYDVLHSVAGIGAGGIDADGTACVDWWNLSYPGEYINGGTGDVGGSGYWVSPVQPNSNSLWKAATVTFTQTPGGSANPGVPAHVSAASCNVAAYSANSRVRDMVVVWMAGSVSTVHGIFFDFNGRAWSLKFANPITVTADQRLELTFRKSWGRVLAN